MATFWLETLKKAQKTCLVQDGRKKIHFKLEDGRELAEEYDLRTSELQVRKWRQKGGLGGVGKWDFEVGEPPMAMSAIETEGLMESTANPIFMRSDKKKSFGWRIRNLPYPLDTYDVKVDTDNKHIIIRTTNKKYYKKYTIADMERTELQLAQSNISVAHANNTLLIQYNKPAEILEMEKKVQEEISNLKSSEDGDVDCKQS